MTRSVGVRLTDAQYDWLADRALDFDMDLSEAIRDALESGRTLMRILGSRDPRADFEALLDDHRRQEAAEVYREEFGEEPPVED